MANNDEKQRLDLALVARGLVVSRSRAADLIARNLVSVDGQIARRASGLVGPLHRLDVADGAGDYVSRGSLKLIAALDTFGFDPAGQVALDVGASTGGFTSVLLERGAARVYAVDNGRDQLHASLRHNPRVVVLEGVDARTLTSSEIREPVGAITADVSFISLAQVLPAAMALAAPGCWLAALIKPQFEAGPAHVPRTGVIIDPAVHAAAVAKIRDWLAAAPGWQSMGTIPSPIKGGEGNTEFLIGARRHG